MVLPPATDIQIDAAEREPSASPFYVAIASSSAGQKYSKLIET